MMTLTEQNTKASKSADVVVVEPPSILEQTPWPCGIYSFPDENPQREYFNCGIVDWRGGRWLVTRKNEFYHQKGFKNGITLWLLKENKPVSRHDLMFNTVVNAEQHEDARAITRDGNLIISYCNFIQGKTFAHQCIGAVKTDFRVKIPVHVKYGKNGNNIRSNTWNEKNWIWFVHEGLLHFVYKANPHVVCSTRNGAVVQEYKTEAEMVWTWGEVRGGTPPVKVGDEYFSFFHSSTQWRNQKERRYYMGAYAFSAKPSFHVTRYTLEPILTGSPDDIHKTLGPLCVFPQGAIFENGEWLVVGGLNDLRCFHIRIPHKALLERMVEV